MLIALILRAFVPGGYMPDPSARAQGLISLTLCTAHDGSALLVVALDTQGTHHDSTSQNCPLCVLAHHASGSPLPAHAGLMPSAPAVTVTIYATPHTHPVFRIPSAPLGARAPPSALTI